MHGGLSAWRIPRGSSRRRFQQWPLHRAVQTRLGPFFHRLARLGHSQFGAAIFQHFSVVFFLSTNVILLVLLELSVGVGGFEPVTSFPPFSFHPSPTTALTLYFLLFFLRLFAL